MSDFAEARRLLEEQVAAERAKAAAAADPPATPVATPVTMPVTTAAGDEDAAEARERARADAELDRRLAEYGRADPNSDSLTDSGPPPPTYQPDPAVYEPARLPDAPPRRRLLGRRGATPAAPPAPASASALAPAEPEPAPAPAPSEPAPAPASSEPASTDAGPPYPWRRTEAVDLDLHGAPTWNPETPTDESATDESATDESATDESATDESAARGPASEPVPEPGRQPVPAPVPEPEPLPAPTPIARLLRRLQRPGGAPREPLQPAEPVAALEPAPPARPRPRPGPRPVARPESTPPRPSTPVEPAATAATVATGAVPPAGPDPADRPRPRPRPAPVDLTKSDDSDRTSLRSPDISRFLDASEPQEGDDEKEPKEPGRRRARIRGSKLARTGVRIAIVVVIAIVVAVVLRTYVVAPYYIPSASMEPTLIGCQKCTDDHVLVDKFSYHFHNPHQSDIVVFNRPKDLRVNEKVLIKRVIAIPGDHVALKQGLVYVNGKRLKEPYINKACGAHPSVPETGKSTWVIPPNDYFVMGDNRCDSTDSRTFGPIPKSSIVGRAFAIIWPLKRIGGI